MNYEIKNNIFHTIDSYGDVLTIEYEGSINCYQSRELSSIIGWLATEEIFKCAQYLHISYHSYNNLSRQNMHKYLIEVCISNIIIYIENCGIKVKI